MPPTAHTPARLAVFISGGGRTLLNLHEQIRAGRLSATIGLVVASGEVAGAARARELGLPVEVVPGRIAPDRLAAMLSAHGIAYVALAGYLKLLPVLGEYRRRVVNIHPALLPAFGGAGMYGHRVHEAVLAAGCKVSGCTVHMVNDEYDRGPIIAQAVCPVLDDDTPETLAARVFELECRTYPTALSYLVAGRVEVVGNRTRLRPE